MKISNDITIKFDEYQIAKNLFNFKGVPFKALQYYLQTLNEPYYPFFELITKYIVNEYYDEFEKSSDAIKVLTRYVVLSCYKTFKFFSKIKINYFDELLNNEITFKSLLMTPKIKRNDDDLLKIYKRGTYLGEYAINCKKYDISKHKIKDERLNLILSSIRTTVDIIFSEDNRNDKKLSRYIYIMKYKNNRNSFINHRKSYSSIYRANEDKTNYLVFNIKLNKPYNFFQKINENFTPSYLNFFILAQALGSAILNNKTNIDDIFPTKSVAFCYLFIYPRKTHNTNIVYNEDIIRRNSTVDKNTKLLFYKKGDASFNYMLLEDNVLNFKCNNENYVLTSQGIKKEAFASAKELNP